MSETIPIPSEARADHEASEHGAPGLHDVTPDLAYQRLAIVNVVFAGPPGAADWVLIDAGVAGMAGMIIRAAEARYGAGSRPAAIVLTHGHFDHVGSLESLARKWDVPVYAHELEFPYLRGEASYPPPDPTVGGGLMSALAGFYPRGPIDVRRWLRALPADRSVPPMPGWRWEPVPGHTPGQVALWRDADRALVAADAFITTKQESAYAVMTQAAEMHGPPMYYTQDWAAAKESVRRLAALEPEVAIAGHGRPIHGPALRASLRRLASDFDEVAVPKHGKYVERPARPDDGSAYPAKS
jgi:glyoxylase-like metal-dependent hydrolase (beta-lactamase superfamily II)